MENLNKRDCIDKMLEDYGPSITVDFLLGMIYKCIYLAENFDAEEARWYYRYIYLTENFDVDYMQEARWYYNYINTRLYSAVHGKNKVKLYMFLRSKLEAKECQ